jgi:hypothetical protein
MTLKLIHGFENLLTSLVYRIVTGDCQSWLFTQVALYVVYYLRGPGEGLFLIFTSIKKDILSLFVNKGKGL